MGLLGRLKKGKDSGALFLESILRMGSGFIVGILLARQYGPEGLGLITTSSSAVTIFMGFSALGLSGVLIRELVEKKDRQGSILLTVTMGKLAAGLILLFGLVLSIMSFSDSPDLTTLCLIMALGYLFASLDTVDALYNARSEFTRLVALRLAALAVSTVFKVLAIVLGWGLEYVALGYGLDYALVYLLPALDFVIRRKHGIRSGEIRLSFDLPELGHLLRRSWPVLISGGFAQVNLKIDSLMIAAMASVAQVGIYSAASRLSEAWSVLAMAMVTAAFPGLVKAAKIDVVRYGRQLSALLGKLTWISVAGAVAITLLAPLIINLLYGREFDAASSVLAIHVFGGVFLFLRTAVSRWLIIEDLLKFSLVSHVSGAVVNVSLNLVLIPSYGVVGAAWASVASYATSGLLFLLFTRRTRFMFWMILWSALPGRFGLRRVDALALLMAESRGRKE